MRSTLEFPKKTWLLAAVTLTLVACSGIEVTEPESGLPWSGPELPTGGDGGGGEADTTVRTNDQALVGSWTRLLLFTDAGGTQRGSRLTYQFRSDSTFTRTLVTSNFTLGLEDTVVESGVWTGSLGTLLLRSNIGRPNESSTRFNYRLARRSDGNQILLLDDSGFVRD